MVDAGRTDTTRRAFLGSVGTALAMATAGCSSDGSIPMSGAETTRRTPGRTPSNCEGGEDGGFLDRRLFPLGDWYGGSELFFQSFVARRLFRHTSWFGLVQPYLARFLRLHRERIPFRLARAERVSILRPPSGHFPGYIHYRTDFSKRRILLKFQSGAASLGSVCQDFSRCVRINDSPGYRGYTVKTSPRPALSLLAYDDESFVVVPDATSSSRAGGDGWRLSSRRRFKRLVDLKLGDLAPYHCSNPHVRPIARRVGTSDFLRLRFRTDRGTYGGESAIPAGARAHAIGADFVYDEDLTPRTPDALPEARNVAVDLSYYAVFGDGGNEHDRSVLDFLDRRLPSGGLSFRNPSVESDGRLVRVSERRPIATLLNL